MGGRDRIKTERKQVDFDEPGPRKSVHARLQGRQRQREKGREREEAAKRGELSNQRGMNVFLRLTGARCLDNVD